MIVVSRVSAQADIHYIQENRKNWRWRKKKRKEKKRTLRKHTKHRLCLKEIVRHLDNPLVHLLPRRIRQHIRQVLQHETARGQVRHAREDPLEVEAMAAPDVDEQLLVAAGAGAVEAVQEPRNVVHLGPVQAVLHLALHVPAKVAPELRVVHKELPAVVALRARDVHEVALLGVQRVLVVGAGEEFGEVVAGWIRDFLPVMISTIYIMLASLSLCMCVRVRFARPTRCLSKKAFQFQDQGLAAHSLLRSPAKMVSHSKTMAISEKG